MAAGEKKDSKGKAGNGEGSPVEEAAEAPGQPAGMTDAPPPIVIGAQYIKDLSFEVPGAPNIFEEMRDSQPDISVNIDVNVQPIKDNAFEVILRAKADCKIKGAIAFIMELTYAGIFVLNVPEEHLQPILLVECPRLLFPFARNILAETTRDGGFPPLMLGPVDFMSMFQNQVEQQGAQA